MPVAHTGRLGPVAKRCPVPLPAHETAAELRQQEFSRLSAATVPTLESLRFLNPRQFRARVAGMLERLGYELLTPETASDLLARTNERPTWYA